MNGRRAALPLALGAALAVVAALTLTPEGAGWSWGAPAAELRWYATGLGSPATVRQLLGNLGLLVAPAVLAVLRWPALGRPSRLVALAAAAGTAIELLQWALPLGRVVSPLDAALNAAGAVVAGLLVAGGRRSAPGPGGRMARFRRGWWDRQSPAAAMR
ncbi:VanZ family protein [Blastococcus sp. SYSU DS0533]